MKRGDPQGFCKSCGEELPPYRGSGPKREFCVKAECNKNTRFRVITVRRSKHWSSHGRTINNLVNEESRWFCQGCGEEFPDELTPFGMKVNGDVFKICGKCYRKVLENKFQHIIELIQLVRNL